MAGTTGPEGQEEEDDYLSMAFTTTGPSSTAPKETSVQRTARLKRERLDHSRPLSKSELAAREKAQREAALATRLGPSNKGAQMLARMGFKGGALGKAEHARTQPIEMLMKEDRGGVGMDAEKKRKVREAAEGLQKRQKVGEEEFRKRGAEEREERRAEGMMWSAMRTLEGFETGERDNGEEKKDGVDGGMQRLPPLRSINVLWRPLVRQRLERERQRRRRYDLEQSLSRRADYFDPDAEKEDQLAFADEVEELEDEEDEELAVFENLSFAERLEKIVNYLKQKYFYCFWCKYRYDTVEREGCPGESEEDHG